MKSQYIEELNKKIEAVNTCEQLEKIQLEIAKALGDLKASIMDEIPSLTTLSTPPTDLVSAINWISEATKHFILPLIAYQQELSELAQQIQSIESNIQNKISTLGCSIDKSLGV